SRWPTAPSPTSPNWKTPSPTAAAPSAPTADGSRPTPGSTGGRASAADHISDHPEPVLPAATRWSVPGSSSPNCSRPEPDRAPSGTHRGPTVLSATPVKCLLLGHRQRRDLLAGRWRPPALNRPNITIGSESLERGSYLLDLLDDTGTVEDGTNG